MGVHRRKAGTGRGHTQRAQRGSTKKAKAAKHQERNEHEKKQERRGIQRHDQKKRCLRPGLAPLWACCACSLVRVELGRADAHLRLEHRPLGRSRQLRVPKHHQVVIKRRQQQRQLCSANSVATIIMFRKQPTTSTTSENNLQHQRRRRRRRQGRNVRSVAAPWILTGW